MTDSTAYYFLFSSSFFQSMLYLWRQDQEVSVVEIVLKYFLEDLFTNRIFICWVCKLIGQCLIPINHLFLLRYKCNEHPFIHFFVYYHLNPPFVDHGCIMQGSLQTYNKEKVFTPENLQYTWKRRWNNRARWTIRVQKEKKDKIKNEQNWAERQKSLMTPGKRRNINIKIWYLTRNVLRCTDLKKPHNNIYFNYFLSINFIAFLTF